MSDRDVAQIMYIYMFLKLLRRDNYIFAINIRLKI